MKYALVKDGAVDKIREWGDDTPPDLSHKVGATLEWLPYVENAQPAYDQHREKLESSETINAGVDVQKSWTAVLKSKDERKAAVESYSASQVEGGMGDIYDRLAKQAQAAMLLDALQAGTVDGTNADVIAMRALGTWWQATQDHKDSLKADIDADLDPDITAGWPVLGA